ncbi:DUF4838 domain-containing protein [Paenibacillus eucommiae]|uniref:SLH domain-containing protein n=1 Tax=Paenibacillus eucommiae TaxID=1355755 RepID=A0ABS4J1V0_9BACL|nr:DUF4838 domain-containing protein [Paenibacillus eucommiae]MBP1993763.1 hypothetical protein [Paenibacillus eucommiae]
MKTKKYSQKCMAVLVAFCLLFTSFQHVLAANNTQIDASVNASGDTAALNAAPINLSDVNGHWAGEQVQEWLDLGRIQGYPDGMFKPDNPITRGEFIALVNRSFAFQDKSSISFTDLKAADWEYEEIAKAVKAGYVEGYPDGTIGSKRQISRLEASVMIVRLLKLNGQADNNLAATFSDFKQMAKWGQAAVGIAAAEQIMSGYEDGSFRPTAPITRAETVVSLNRALTPRTYEKAGVYGPTAEKEIVSRDVVVNTAGVTLRNMTITGNLLLAEGISEGDVTLNNVTVQGITTVNGGGKNSVHFRDSTLETVIVDKRSGTVRVIVEGSTIIATITVKSSTMLETADLTGQGFREVSLSDALPVDAQVTLKGSFETVNVLAKGLKLEIPQGSVKLLHVFEKATNVNLDTGNDAVIVLLILDAVIKVFGQGTIESVTIGEKAKASTFEKQPLKKDGAGVSSSNGGGGNSGSSTPTATPAATPTATPTVTPTPTDPGLRIVENGLSQAVIVIDPNATAKVTSAAATLAEYVFKSTSATLPVLTMSELTASGSQYDGDVRIYVGSSDPGSQVTVTAALQDMKDDGFVIMPHENTISIIGPTDWGTTFGVNEFLEHYVGVRWLLPGPDGYDVPLHSTIDVSQEIIRDEPKGISRSFFYLTTPENAEWGLRNGIHDNIQFHHNMATLFDPEDLDLKQHPEYYVDNEIPTHWYDWQPCYNDTTAAVASQRIKAFFAANPDATSYSLGINDSERYCAADKALAGGKLNSSGFLDMSDVYYPWVNKVVEAVLADERYEDKYFGLLAYWHMYEPPTNVQLNSHVIPYITDDRMSWGDPALAGKGKQLVEAWGDAASNIGWYEYLYGSPYNVPRVYMNRMAENYKYAQDNGVIAHVAEIYPNFAEGPKPWISVKLQWDADQDVNVLLNEWYTSAVGPDAAADLKAYYDLWENFWNIRIFESAWYKRWKESDPRSNFMRFDQPDYLEAVTKEDITESRRLLEQVVIKAQTSKQKIRAEKLLRGFEFYEASALSFPKTTPVDAPKNNPEALVMLNDIKKSYEMVKKRFILPTAFAGDPILNLPSAPPKAGGTWDGVQNVLITALQSYIATHPEDVVISEGLNLFLDSLNKSNFSANAVKTTASKDRILQSLDFSKGPWVDAEPVSDFMVMGTKIDIPNKTNLYLLWDDVNLYVGYENFDSNMSGMTVSTSAPNYWWNSGADDSVETYFTANPDVSFKGFFSNPKDVKFSYQKIGLGEPSPNPGEVWETNSIIKSDRWNTVQVIPFANIGVDPNAATELKGFFLRNYHAQTWFLGWGGGYPWKPEYFKPIHLVESNNLVLDSSFETGEENDLSLSSNWWYWGDENAAEPGKRTMEIKRSGNYSFDVGSPTHAGLVQNVPVTGGKHKFIMYYNVPQGSETTGSIQVVGTVNNAVGGPPLTTIVSDATPVSTSGNGQWVKYEFEFEIQPDYDGVQPHNLNLTVVLRDFQLGKKLYVDDIAIYKLPDYSVEAQLDAVNVQFNDTFLQAPDIAKFTVERQINDQAVMTVTPSAIVWDSATHKATLTVPVIPTSSEKQSVWYFLSYDNGTVVESLPFVIAAEGGLTNLVKNSSFESGDNLDLSVTPNWWYWGDENAAEPGTRTTEIKRSGHYSFDAGSPTHAGLVQNIPVISGKHKFIMYYNVPQGSGTTGSIQVVGTVNNEVGGPALATFVSEATQVSTSGNGQWIKYEYEFEIQPDYSGVQPHNLNVTVVLRDFQLGRKLYIDDITVYKLSDPDYSVQAKNGMIDVLFNDTFQQAPDITKFKVQKQVNGQAAVSVTPSAIVWDSATHKATLTVPVIPESSEEQSVVYLVSYDSGVISASLPFVISATVEGGFTNLIVNASFESGNAADLSVTPNWWYWGDEEIAEPGKRTTEIKHTGDYSFDVGSPTHAGLVQDVPVTSGKHKFIMYYNVPQGSGTTGSIQVVGTVNNEIGGPALATFVSEATQVSTSGNGQWVKYEYEFEIQPDYSGVQPHNLNVTVVLRDFQLGKKLYIDDIAIYKLPEYSVQAQTGTINVLFDDTLLQTPDMSKFTVQLQINSHAAVSVSPTAIVWDSATHKATLTVPVIPGSSEEQSVVYLVSYDAGAVRESVPFVIAIEDGMTNLIVNSSFESGDAVDLSITPNWWYWGANPADPGKRTTEIKRSGSYSFEVGSPSQAGLVQNVPVTSGKYKFIMHYYVPQGSVTLGSFRLDGTVSNEVGGTPLANIFTDKTPVSTSENGQWVKYESEFEIQPDYLGVQPHNYNLTVVLYDFQSGEKLYIDDIAIYKLVN